MRKLRALKCFVCGIEEKREKALRAQFLHAEFIFHRVVNPNGSGGRGVESVRRLSKCEVPASCRFRLENTHLLVVRHPTRVQFCPSSSESWEMSESEQGCAFLRHTTYSRGLSQAQWKLGLIHSGDEMLAHTYTHTHAGQQGAIWKH